MAVHVGETQIHQVCAEVLKDMGRWMKTNGKAIYGCTASAITGMGCGLSTARGNTAYLHVHHWPGKNFIVPDVKCKVLAARILATGKKLKHVQRGTRLLLELPEKDTGKKALNVISLKCDRNVEA